MECLKELLRLERGWLPEREGYSLYIRPFMFGSSHSLGISRPTRSTIAIMLSPVGPYFQTGAGVAVAQHVHMSSPVTHGRAVEKRRRLRLLRMCWLWQCSAQLEMLVSTHSAASLGHLTHGWWHC